MDARGGLKVKFASFIADDKGPRLGLVTEKGVFDLHEADAGLPDNMLDLVKMSDEMLPRAEKACKKARRFYEAAEVGFRAPLANPVSFRDFMGFSEHHESCRRNKGQPVDPVYYQIPVFYFSNTNVMVGSSEAVKAPKKCNKLDFEFEVGFVIGKPGRDIPKEHALDHVFGFTIINDWSARDLQGEEMKVLLGPAKGKDFATSIGPFLVTKDEWTPYLMENGCNYDRRTKLTLNGRVLRENNLNTIHHSFSSMIERASEDVTLYPGELFGSGTIGGGCILEYSPGSIPWLSKGDRIEMEVEGLGILRNLVD